MRKILNKSTKALMMICLLLITIGSVSMVASAAVNPVVRSKIISKPNNDVTPDGNTGTVRIDIYTAKPMDGLAVRVQARLCVNGNCQDWIDLGYPSSDGEKWYVKLTGEAGEYIVAGILQNGKDPIVRTTTVKITGIRFIDNLRNYYIQFPGATSLSSGSSSSQVESLSLS